MLFFRAMFRPYFNAFALLLLIQPSFLNAQTVGGLESNSKVDCQTWTKQDWYNYFKKNIEKIELDTSVSKSSALKVSFDQPWREMSEALKSCEKNLRDYHLYDASLRIRNFLSVGFQLMYRTHDKARFQTEEYYKNQPASVVGLPEEFQKGIPENWEKIANQNHWPIHTFTPTIVYDITRAVVFVGSDSVDKWLLFEPAKRDILDFIAVQKKDEKGNGLERFRVYFQEWGAWIDRKKNPRFSQVPDTPDCASCHITGLIKLPKSDDNGADALNYTIATYHFPENSGLVHPTYYGPPMNSSELKCAECHDGVERAPINLFTNPTIMRSKMLTFQTMPPRSSLSLDDRKKLYTEMLTSYEADLKKWLLEEVENEMKAFTK